MTAARDGGPPNLVVLYPEPDAHDDEQPVTKSAGEVCSHWKVRLDPDARSRLRRVDPAAVAPPKPWGDGMPL